MRLRLRLRDETGALQRVLVQLTQRRIRFGNLSSHRGAQGLDVEVELEGARQPQLLVRVLERLRDVVEVELLPESSPTPNPSEVIP